MPPTSLNHPKSTPWKETKVNSRKMSQILEQQRIKTLCQPPQPPCTQRNEECKNIFPPFKNSWLALSPQFLHKLHPHPPNPVSPPPPPKECIKSKCLLEYFPPLSSTYTCVPSILSMDQKLSQRTLQTPLIWISPHSFQITLWLV